jgi:hypothetical protein
VKTVTTLNLGSRRNGHPLAKFSSVGLLLALILLVPGLRPQLDATPQHVKPGEPYALIFGTVWGPDDHPVYGVTVKIRRSTDKPKKVRWEVSSDHNGEFAQRVPAGEMDYILSADLKDFKFADGTRAHAQEVTVHVYNEERIDTGLHLTH